MMMSYEEWRRLNEKGGDQHPTWTSGSIVAHRNGRHRGTIVGLVPDPTQNWGAAAETAPRTHYVVKFHRTNNQGVFSRRKMDENFVTMVGAKPRKRHAAFSKFKFQHHELFR